MHNLLKPVTDPNIEADLYCELNSSTHFHVEIGNAAGSGQFDLKTIQNLAVLVLNFESEIDKMLDDHMGYITENVCAPPVTPSSRACTAPD